MLMHARTHIDTYARMTLLFVKDSYTNDTENENINGKEERFKWIGLLSFNLLFGVNVHVVFHSNICTGYTKAKVK